MINKSISVIFAVLLLIFSLSAVTVFALNDGENDDAIVTHGILKEGICGDGVTYSLTTEGVLTVSGNGPIYDYDAESAPWAPYISGGDVVISTLIIEDGVTYVGKSAFKNCSSLTEAVMPSVVTIGDSAFKYCSALTNVTVSEALTEIQPYAFSYCSSLSGIFLPDSIQSIGNNAFEYSGLQSITVPSGAVDIGSYCFYSCTSLNSVTYSSPVVPETCFAQCPFLESVTLIHGVTVISDYAFSGCSSLSSVSVPDTVVSVGSYAFDGCSSLSEISFNGPTYFFGEYAFKNCSSLRSFAFSDYATEIPTGMFMGCESLSELTIGDGITKIGDYAFLNCPSLSSLFLSYKVKYIGQYSLGYTKDAEGYAPLLPDSFSIEGFAPSAAQYYAITNSFEFVTYKTLEYDSGVLNDSVSWTFTPADGRLSFIGSGALPDFNSFEETPWNLYRDYIKAISFDSGITDIGSYYFVGCGLLESVEFPSSLKTIGKYAFSIAGFTEIVIPEGVVSIDNGAFEGCYLLSKVQLPSTLITVGQNAFKATPSLKLITVPSSVIEIGPYAFGFDENNTPCNDFVIKSTEGSIAKVFAESNGISFTLAGSADISTDDGSLKITVVTDEEDGFTAFFERNLNPLAPELLLPNGYSLFIYNVSLVHNGSEFAVDNGASVTFRLPDELIGKALYLFRIDDNGNFQPIPSTVSGGYVSFGTTALGSFIISDCDLSAVRTITVTYTYADGSSVLRTETVRGVTGASYSFTADQIENYTLNNKVYEGIVGDSDITLTFIYTEIAKEPITSETTPETDTEGNVGGTEILLVVLLAVLVIALASAIILLIFINSKKNKKQIERRRTISAAAKKKNEHDAKAETIIVPDFATREIDISSLFADEPEEDVFAEEELKKKIDSLKKKD